MYKVFIDNKEILFAESYKKSEINLAKVLQWDAISTDDLIALRAELAVSVILVVLDADPEKALNACFENYDRIEAAGGIVQRKQRFLFIERNELWDIPKGKIEQNETPAVCAVREIEEECGIRGPEITAFLGITYHTYTFKGVFTLKKNWWYLLSYSGPKVGVPQVEEGITKVVWLKRHEWQMVEENTYASIRAVIDMAKNKFG